MINVVDMGPFVEFITPEEMAQREREASARGITVADLMENAGRGIARTTQARFRPIRGKKIVIVAGLGNNGGDGMVAGRYLALDGASVVLFLLGHSESIRTPESRENWNRLKETNAKTLELTDSEGMDKLERAVRGAKIVVDAIFGTGVRGEIGDPQATAIRMINASPSARISVDIPSGLDPLTGVAKIPTVKADLTLTLHKAKTGLRDRADYTGELIVIPLGIE